MSCGGEAETAEKRERDGIGGKMGAWVVREEDQGETRNEGTGG